MIAASSTELAEMLADPMFTYPLIELRDSFTYELPALDARVGKTITGSHVNRTNIALFGALNLHGRFYWRNMRFKVAPNMRGVNCAWGTHSTLDDCSFTSLDEKNMGAAGLWSDETADNNNSFGIHIARCEFSWLRIGLQIMRGANHVVGGWTVRDTDFSNCERWGLHVRGTAGLYLENLVFQNNGKDAYLHGSEIELHHCHAERQTNAENISVVVATDSDPVLFLGGNIAYKRTRIADLSGRAMFIGAQETHAMLTRMEGAVAAS